MEKKTLYAVIAMILAGVGAVLVMRAPEKGQRQGPPERPIAAFKAAEVAHLELTTEKQEKSILEKKGDKWRLTTPADYPADSAGVKSLLDGLERLGFGDVVTEGAERHEDLGVVEGKAQRVTVKDASGKVLADFFVGKSVSGFTMIRPAGKNTVYQGTGFFPYMASREPKGWRDHVIVELPANEAEKLTVVQGANKLQLEKLADKSDKGEPKWKVLEAAGDAPKIADALDLATVNGVVNGLSTLRAGDFADDKKPEQVGLAAGALTLTLEGKGKSATVLIGQANGEDTYVKTAADPQVYTVKKFSLERVAHRPADFRDKTLAKAGEAQLASIELATGGQSIVLEHADGKWKAKGASLDEGKVKNLAGAFESLAGASFAEDKDPAKTGLGKPTGTVTLRLTDKSTVALKVGALTKDQSEYYVQRVGSPDVVLVKKFQVERFLKKPADLQAAAATATAKNTKK